jgi:hypothetical protein
MARSIEKRAALAWGHHLTGRLRYPRRDDDSRKAAVEPERSPGQGDSIIPITSQSIEIGSVVIVVVMIAKSA